jgi:ABC-2 type transport system permease protein
MSSHSETGHSLPEPGVPVIRNVNWGGLRTLYIKEVRRFFKVQLQTVWAPAVTTLLFLVIFTVALGGGGRTIELQGHPVHFADFIAPGLIVMGMLQNAFANSSFSLLVGKCGGAVTRAFCVGAAVWLAMILWPGVDVTPRHFWAILWFGFLGALFLSLLGVLTSIWAEKFDHAAAVTNFVVAPLSLLSGTFYSVDKLSPVFQTISHLNPFFYIISGFRYGFLGVADSPILTGSFIILALDAVLGLFCYWLLRKGWNLKN